MNTDQRLECSTLSLIHKIKNGNAPDYLCSQMKFVGKVQSGKGKQIQQQFKNLYSIRDFKY